MKPASKKWITLQWVIWTGHHMQDMKKKPLSVMDISLAFAEYCLNEYFHELKNSRDKRTLEKV
jgi:hypothetical protein